MISESPATPSSRWLPAVAIAAGLALAAGLAAGWPALTRPLCWPWAFRDIALGRALALFLPGLVIYAAGLALLRDRRGRRRVGAAVALFAVATFALELGSLFLDEHGFATLELRVESRYVTSYFTDALTAPSPRELLRGFPPDGMHLHSRTHPPGPILYYWFLVRLLGPAHGALAGGLLVGLLAAAVAPALYRFGTLWGAGEIERAHIAALWPLLPAVAGFFPEFDQIYPLATVGLLICVARALEGSRRAAILAGGLAALALFFAWNLLLLALPAGLMVAWRFGSTPRAARPAAASAIALGALAFAVVMALPALAGYDPIHAFRGALAFQARIGLDQSCPWRRAIGSGPWDFVLAAGAIPFVLWSAALTRAFRAHGSRVVAARMTLLGALSILAVDFSSRLPQETARVWLFLMPLVLAPAGIELARLPAKWRGGVLAAQAVVFVVATARLVFIGLS